MWFISQIDLVSAEDDDNKIQGQTREYSTRKLATLKQTAHLNHRAGGHLLVISLFYISSRPYFIMSIKVEKNMIRGRSKRNTTVSLLKKIYISRTTFITNKVKFRN